MQAIVPSFTFKSPNKILEGLVTTGKYDGEHPSFCWATTGGKLALLSPHPLPDGEPTFRTLSINQRVTSLKTMPNAESGRDAILIATRSCLRAYDAHENRDIFFKDVHDGIGAMVVGPMIGHKEGLVIVGGNCTIQGFSYTGEEEFWTVTGDEVSAMALVSREHGYGLVVGSEDCETRVFEDEEVVLELSEADATCSLVNLDRGNYGFGLANGTVGVYGPGGNILWRMKSKSNVVELASFNYLNEKTNHLVIGYASGRVEIRHQSLGTLLAKYKGDSCVAGVLTTDIRLKKTGSSGDLVVVAFTSGTIIGIDQIEMKPLSTPQQTNVVSAAEVEAVESRLAEVSQTKQELLAELRLIDENAKAIKDKSNGPGLVPADTQLSSRFDLSHGSLDLVVSTNNSAVIRCVVLLAEGLFEGESHVVYPDKPTNEGRITLSPSRNIAADMFIKVMVGLPNGTQLHVFELNHRLPKFSSFLLIKGTVKAPSGHVSFKVSSHLQEIIGWLQSCFLGSFSVQPDQALTLQFINQRDNSPLRMEFFTDGKVCIWTDEPALAGDIIQDMAEYLKISTLSSVADFPLEAQTIKNALTTVEQTTSVRLSLTLGIAESSGSVKTEVVKAEDARMCMHMEGMIEAYLEVQRLNRHLGDEYGKRAHNQESLTASLKEINQVIQRSARLRVGPAKAELVAACRAAIKANTPQAFDVILSTGRKA